MKNHFNADSAAFAKREKAQELTGCIIGAIPPLVSIARREQTLHEYNQQNPS